MEKFFNSSEVVTSLKQFSESFLKHLQVPVCLIHKDFEVSYANQRFTDLVGSDFLSSLSSSQKKSLFVLEDQAQYLKFKDCIEETTRLRLEIKKITISDQELRLIQLVEPSHLNQNISESSSVKKESFELGVWLWEIGKNKVIRSKEILKVYEVDTSFKEVSLEEHLSVYREGYRVNIKKKLKAIAEGNLGEEFEEIVLTPKGNIKYLKTKVISNNTYDSKNQKITFSSIDITDFKQSETKLTEQKKLLQESLNLTDNLYKLEREFVLEKIENRSKIYNSFLDTIIDYTDSEFGFLAEVSSHKKQQNHFKIYAASKKISNLNLKKTKQLYAYTLKTGSPRIVNNAVDMNENDIHSYISVPIHKNEELVGLISLGNGRKMYSEITIKRIKPFISSLLLMIEFNRLEMQRKEQEKTIKLNEELELKVKARTEELLQKNEHLNLEIKLRNEVEKSLFYSERLYRNTINNLGSGLSIVSPEGEIITVNNALCEILDYDKKQLVGAKIKTIISEKVFYDQIRFFSENGNVLWCSEEKLYRKDGSRVWCKIYVSVSYTDETTFNYLFSVINIHLQKINEQLFEEERKQRIKSYIEGEEKERKRLSRELHDGLVQKLTAAKLNLGTFCRDENLSNFHKSLLNESKIIMEEIMHEVREISQNLTPAVLSDYGLEEALKLMHEKLRNSAIDFFLEISYKKRLPLEIETALYRITQEGVNNAMKYSKSKEVFVQLKEVGNMFFLSIKDLGVGFNVSEYTYRKGHGLNNIRERCEAIQADFRIISNLGKGTEIRVTIEL